MIDADALAARIQQVPLLSPATQKLIALLRDPAANLREVGDLVMMDPALTLHLLKTANSAALSRGQEIGSVHEAVVRLGEEMVFTVAIKVCAGEVLNHPLKGYAADSSGLWSHSLYTALAARQLARQFPGAPPADVAYTAGLLHDVGKAILSDWLAEVPDWVAERMVDPGDHEFIAVEKRLLGINHQMAGHALARHWKLPEELCEAILHHHKPSEARAASAFLAEIVHVADLLALMAGQTTGADALNYRLDSEGMRHLTFSDEGLDPLVSCIQDEFLRVGMSLLE